MTTWGWLMRVAFGTAAIGITTAAGLLFVYQRALIYPSSFPEGSRTDVDTPEQYDLPYREMRLSTPDGEKLHVYVMLQQDDEKDEKLSEERPTIVMFMANAGNMGHRLPLAVVFYRRLGCNVVMLSYRGYGLSSGEASEHGIRIDAQTMLDWIQAHPILSKTKVITYGQSIGGAVSIDLAARNPKKVAGMILENTYVSLMCLTVQFPEYTRADPISDAFPASVCFLVPYVYVLIQAKFGHQEKQSASSL